jgi:exosortase/archaeosortase family protein
MSGKNKATQQELLLSGALFFLTAFLFAPATLWLVEQTIYFEQLMHAFIILGFAGIYLMMENREKLKLVLEFGNLATGLLIASFLLLGVNIFWNAGLVMLLAYCLAIAAWVIFIFGERLARVVTALLSAFSGYVVLALYLPLFDWPLRSMAGQYSATLLGWFGRQVQLGLTTVGDAKLILLVDGKPFEVAAECNGFGMISGCILLSILLVFYRKIRVFDKVLAVVLAALVGSIFNVARILVICLLAPYFPNSYFFMHEVVGNIFFWGALGLVWWLVHGMDIAKTGASDASGQGKNMVFFDGECFMCNKSMRFLLRIDKHQRLWFAPLQGKAAREVIERRDDLDYDLKTIIYIEDVGTEQETVFIRSTAVLKAMSRAGGVWSLVEVMLVVPAFLRDAGYNFVAKNRLKWFGKTEMCSLIPPEQRERLLN